MQDPKDILFKKINVNNDGAKIVFDIIFGQLELYDAKQKFLKDFLILDQNVEIIPRVMIRVRSWLTSRNKYGAISYVRAFPEALHAVKFTSSLHGRSLSKNPPSQKSWDNAFKLIESAKNNLISNEDPDLNTFQRDEALNALDTTRVLAGISQGRDTSSTIAIINIAKLYAPYDKSTKRSEFYYEFAKDFIIMIRRELGIEPLSGYTLPRAKN